MCNIYDEKWRKGHSWYEERLEKYAKRGFDICILKTDFQLTSWYKAACVEVREVDVMSTTQLNSNNWAIPLSKNLGVYRLAVAHALSNR